MRTEHSDVNDDSRRTVACWLLVGLLLLVAAGCGGGGTPSGYNSIDAGSPYLRQNGYVVYIVGTVHFFNDRKTSWDGVDCAEGVGYLRFQSGARLEGDTYVSQSSAGHYRVRINGDQMEPPEEFRARDGENEILLDIDEGWTTELQISCPDPSA